MCCFLNAEPPDVFRHREPCGGDMDSELWEYPSLFVTSGLNHKGALGQIQGKNILPEP